MGKKPRPKSKEEKLRERRKHFLDDEKDSELFLDEGGEDDVMPSEEDDDMPEEVSTKKSQHSGDAPLPEKKKKRKRKIKKEGPGIFNIETEEVKLKVVAAASKPMPSQMLEPSLNFRELLLQESSKQGRRKTGNISKKHVDKWIKRR